MTFYLILVLAFVLASSVEAQVYRDSRDGNHYSYVEIEGLLWFTENLRFEVEQSISVIDSSMDWTSACGSFYLVDDALTICPDQWRLPTEVEVKRLIKLQKKKRIDIIDTLQISLCGRIDYQTLAKVGQQNTFWMDAELHDGYINHWHIFGERQELHDHNVVVSQRQFPVRCVCEKSVLED